MTADQRILRGASVSPSQLAELVSDPAARDRLHRALRSTGRRLLVLRPSPTESFDASIGVAQLLGALPESFFVIATSGAPLPDLPYNFARRLATLEHLSQGRIGWQTQPPAVAQDAAIVSDYVETVEQLWASWPLDSVATDRSADAFADVSRIRRVNTAGHFPVQGPLNVPSSPQGAPVVVGYDGGPATDGSPHSYADLIGDAADPEVWRVPGTDRVRAEIAAQTPGDVGELTRALVEAGEHVTGGDPPGGGPPTLRASLGLDIPVLAASTGSSDRFSDPVHDRG